MWGAHEFAQASCKGLSRSVWAKGGIQLKTGHFSHSAFPSTPKALAAYS